MLYAAMGVALYFAAPWLLTPTEPTDAELAELDRALAELHARSIVVLSRPPTARQPKLLIRSLDGLDAEADCAHWTVTIDPAAIVRDFAYIHTEILPHELAHLIDCEAGNGLPPDDPHGPGWAALYDALRPANSLRYGAPRP